MHRRQFINAAASAFLLPASLAHAGQPAEPVSTPAATPQHHGRPRPIVLGDGIELIDYRIYPSQDAPRIIGEISSTRDEMVDSPVVSITFPELGEAGLAYAPPVLPVMRPGESNMIFGVLPASIHSNELLSSAHFDLCDSPKRGQWTERFSGTDFILSLIEELYWSDSLNVRGFASNVGVREITDTAIQGFLRDQADRYVGTSTRAFTGAFAPGHKGEFFLWASKTNPTLADPYLLLRESESYQLEARLSVVDFFSSPGCSSLIR